MDTGTSFVTEGTNYAIHIKSPPPIFMKGILDFPNFCSALIELIGVDNFFCESAGDRLKIQISNPESYRTLIRYLKERKAEYHTYKLREDKPTRVVICDIHPSTPTDLIKTFFTRPPKVHSLCFSLTWNQLLIQMIFTSSHLYYILK